MEYLKYHWLKLVSVLLVILIFAGIFIFAVHFYPLFYRPMLINQHSKVIIKIDKSMPASTLVHTLKKQGLVLPEQLVISFIRTQGLAQRLKAGVYQVKQGESTAHFLHRVVDGDVLKQSFSIIEGTTQTQISANLEHAPYLDYDPNDWAKIAGNRPNAEGLLLADTYNYNSGSRSKSLFELAHAKLQQFLEHCWQERSEHLPYKTPYELLIAASILEKETANSRERRLISGVIINRLRKNMPLQMDPTVIYALGTKYKGKLSREDLRFDSPYNSYRHRGLPPTPIAMVGKDAIDAAAHPEQTDYLYFVATGDGSHFFSVNYEQQKEAVARYRNRKEN